MTFCSVPRRDYFSLRAPAGPLIPFGDMGTLSGTHFQKIIIVNFVKKGEISRAKGRDFFATYFVINGWHRGRFIFIVTFNIAKTSLQKR